MTVQQIHQPSISYLDMQANIGITKHNGGFAATNELLALCHVDEAHEVLEVGCGIGVGPTHMAKQYGCHVVGIDISPQMIAWSRQRARQEHVEEKVTLQVADVLDLPFAANRFDVVLCESVLAFVQDKRRAIQECIRVTKPGGYVGLNEAYFRQEGSPELAARAQASIGAEVPTDAAWRALWDGAGLQECTVKFYPIVPSQEIKDRIQWVGWRWILSAWGRMIRLYVTRPDVRHLLHEMLDAPAEVMRQMGYGLLVGRKPCR
ncbi:MAG: class I SAM-dependent methyltransferase [Caldilineaceae bacterium]|nr:class I SAM-dependent methyltransferase [Caldilineaceae bacterium]